MQKVKNKNKCLVEICKRLKDRSQPEYNIAIITMLTEIYKTDLDPQVILNIRIGLTFTEE